MEIGGSTHSLIALGTALSQTRTENAMSVSMLKKGLDTQAAALRLIATVQQIPPLPAGDSGGSQVDVIV